MLCKNIHLYSPHMFYKYSYQCGVLPRSIAITLFDKMILPIVLYGSDVWGFEFSEICEIVQYVFFRRITGLSTNSSNLVLLGEIDRYPLVLHYFERCIYKVLAKSHSNAHSEVSTCICYQSRLHNNGRHTLATDIALLLTKFGFQYVSEHQDLVVNKDVFFKVLCLRIKKSFKIKIRKRYQRL